MKTLGVLHCHLLRHGFVPPTPAALEDADSDACVTELRRPQYCTLLPLFGTVILILASS